MKEIEFSDPSELSCQESLLEWQREIILEETNPKIRLADLEKLDNDNAKNKTAPPKK